MKQLKPQAPDKFVKLIISETQWLYGYQQLRGGSVGFRAHAFERPSRTMASQTRESEPAPAAEAPTSFKQIAFRILLVIGSLVVSLAETSSRAS